MERCNKTFAALLASLLLCGRAASGQVAASCSADFEILENGEITAEFNIRPGSGTMGPLQLLVLPLSLGLQHEFSSANDVRVRDLASGKGYTVLAITSPIGANPIAFEIKKATGISETPDGKGKFEVDTSLPYMSQSDKDLLELPICIRKFDISVVLPRKYDETDESAFPSVFSSTDTQKFELKDVEIGGKSLKKLWLVFPNPEKHELDAAEVTLGGLFAVLGVFVQLGTLRLRERSRTIIVAILIVSIVIVVVAGVYLATLSGAKKVEFLIFGIALSLNALWAIGASVLALVEKSLQAEVVGQVNVNNVPSQFSTVELHEKRSVGGATKDILVKSTDKLQLGGTYAFYLWKVRPTSDYQIVAKDQAMESRSNEFKLAPGRRKSVPIVNLT